MSTGTVRKIAWGGLGTLLGLGVAVLVLLTVARSPAEQQRDPTSTPPALLSETDGAIREVALHYVPKIFGAVRETYTDYLRALPRDVTLRVVVANDLSTADQRRLRGFFDDIDTTLWARTRIVPSPGPITTWSKDRALVTAPSPEGPAWLVATAEPDHKWPERYGDWLTVDALARTSSKRFERHVAPFDFDAGDFAVAKGHIIVDANLILKNQRRGIVDAGALEHRLEAWFGAPVVVLGTRPGDTPPHHLSMYMTPLHDDVVLVGDPRRARDLLGPDFRPGADSAETGRPLVADFSTATQRRFDNAAERLAQLGYRVIRIPNVPLEDKTYLTYTNGVYETRDGRHIAYLPTYGINELDLAARETYARLGWEVRPIRVRHVYPFHGTIGCLVNVLARG